jgi:hypothetical protein
VSREDTRQRNLCRVPTVWHSAKKLLQNREKSLCRVSPRGHSAKTALPSARDLALGKVYFKIKKNFAECQITGTRQSTRIYRRQPFLPHSLTHSQPPPLRPHRRRALAAAAVPSLAPAPRRRRALAPAPPCPRARAAPPQPRPPSPPCPQPRPRPPCPSPAVPVVPLARRASCPLLCPRLSCP